MKIVTLFVIFIILNNCSELKEDDSEEFPPSMDARAKISRDKGQCKRDIPRLQRPQNQQRVYNLPPRFHNQQPLNQPTQKRQEEFELNPEASDFVSNKPKIDLGLTNHLRKRKFFKDTDGNEITLTLNDKQKGLTVNFKTPYVVPEGKIKFSIEGEINISDYGIQNPDIKLGYFALPKLKNNTIQSRVAEEVQNQQPSIKLLFAQHGMIQEYKVKLNLRKETRSTNEITGTVEEYKHPHHQEKKYKKSSKAFNLKHDVKYVARKTKKTTPCGQSKNEFGNQQQSKNDIPFMEKDTIIKTTERRLENIDTILCDVDSLKPAQLRDYLKEFLREEDICRNWKKKPMQKKLKWILNAKRESLQNIVTANKTQAAIDNKTQAAIDISVRKLSSSMTREGYIQSPFFGEVWNYRLEEFPVVLNYKKKMFVFKRICRNFVSFKDENQKEILLEYKTKGTDIVDAVFVAKLQNDHDHNFFHQPKTNVKHEISRIFEAVFEQIPKEINLNEIQIFKASIKNIRDVKFNLLTNGKVGEGAPNNKGEQKEQERG